MRNVIDYKKDGGNSVATIKDVSKFCGVSVATVSRVINRDANVRESTRRKVLEAIDELHYVPNAIAKNLRTDKRCV